MFIKKAIKKGRNSFKRLFGSESSSRMSDDIQKIKNSSLFSETYYLDTYPDVVSSGIDAATHYYLYGAKELRNPSARFSTSAYLSIAGDINGNPLLHCIDYMASHPGFVPPGMTISYIDDMAAEFFGNECVSLKSRVASDSSRNRINLFFADTEKGFTDTALSVSLLLAAQYCNIYNFDLRIISDKPADKEFKEHINDLNISISRNVNVEFYAKSSRMYIDICPKDIFICADWRNADCVLNTPNAPGKIFYVVEDANNFFCKNGDVAIKIQNILKNDQVVPVACSEPLYDYLCKEEFGSAKKASVCLDSFTVFNALAPSEQSFSDKEKYKLVLWGDTRSSGNMFYFGVAAINEALKHNVIVPEQWSITVVCDSSISDFKFDISEDMEIVRNLTADNYKALLSSADLFISFAYGPALPQTVIDSALAGAVCLTNKYTDSSDLGRYSDNIIAVNADTDDVLSGMREAIRLAENPKLRRANYEGTVNICKDRSEALSRAAEHMKEITENM